MHEYWFRRKLQELCSCGGMLASLVREVQLTDVDPQDNQCVNLGSDYEDKISSLRVFSLVHCSFYMWVVRIFIVQLLLIRLASKC